MVDYLIKGETLNTIANGVRNVSGVNKELTPSSMAEIMSSLSVTGVDTFDATAVSNEIFANKTAYVDGEKVTGTFSIDNELNTLDTLINDISKALEGKAAGGESNLQSKTITPTTSQQTVKPDSGYDGLSQVTVNAMTTATQATPSISVSSSGLITASSTQSAGYVSAGTKSATKQLTVQAAQTITPSTSDKTIASGRYLTGTQTIKGDVNLKAENIAEGISIFGVTGTHSGGGGGAVETCDVTIINEVNDFFSVAYMHPEDGLNLTSVGGVGSTDILTLTIADNSMLCICPMPNNFTLTNVEDRRVLSGEALTLHISNPSGGSATITLSNSSPDMPPDPI